jgi:type I restriction enzyme M protein
MVALGDPKLFRVESGGTPKSEVAEYWGGDVAWATLVDLPATDCVSEIRTTRRTITEPGLAASSAKLLPPNSVLVSTRATIGRIGIGRIPLATNQGFKNIVVEDASRAVPEYVAFALTDVVPLMEAWATGGTFKELSKSKFCQLQIPLPPLAIQLAIVAEIEAEQVLVNANRQLIARLENKVHATLARVWGEQEGTGSVREADSQGTSTMRQKAPAPSGP